MGVTHVDAPILLPCKPSSTAQVTTIDDIRPFTQEDRLPNQANRDGQVEIGPCSIGRENFSGNAADCECETASVA